jgi:two-component system, cell cycle sensor histidine kinase and response regulator CckA
MGALAETNIKPDSTERPEQYLSAAERMETLGRLVSGVAHDFNNLLTGIVLCSDLLINGLEESSRLRHYAEEIRTASAQGAAMIQNLLSVARQRRQAPTLLSLNDVILSMRGLLTRLIGETVQLQVELAVDVKAVRMDVAELQEIILNLVLNARDAMPEGGKISLSTRSCFANMRGHSLEPCVDLIVSDSGVGMNAQTQARAFDLFFTTKPAGKGTGLGLATVHRIVRQQGGTVEIESALGKGTLVMIRLPANDWNQQSQNTQRREIL